MCLCPPVSYWFLTEGSQSELKIPFQSLPFQESIHDCCIDSLLCQPLHYLYACSMVKDKNLLRCDVRLAWKKVNLFCSIWDHLGQFAGPWPEQFEGRHAGLVAPKKYPKNFTSQKKKYFIMFEIYFWASDVFQQLLKRSKIL